ncbi:MAG: methyltransferase domain-containing protein [Bacteroidales bacterium]|nr:methyltransferase domain-containing protein [Bacteroidales bacterium]
MDAERPKKTSYEYGKEAQEKLRTYYYQSKIKDEANHEYQRKKLAIKLVDRAHKDYFKEINKSSITLVDIGCSVGTFAIEFSKAGYKTIGIDFDPEAIKIARELNEEEHTNAEFYQMDLADWKTSFAKIDIAVCFDIFEHLHDDELGALFYILKKQLSVSGCVIFHTLPQEYDYLFWSNKRGIIRFPFLLNPFKYMGKAIFQKLVRSYSLLYDIGLVLFKNKTHKQFIKKDGHPNPLTKERLTDIFERANYSVTYMESGFISNQFKKRDKKYFEKHPITHRSLWGIAVPDKN